MTNETRAVDEKAGPWLRPELVAPWWEIAVVVLAVIGQSTLMSTWQAWHGSSQHYVNDLVTDRRMLRALVTESALLGLLFLYLNRRGWKPADLRIRPSWIGSAQGILLIFGMMLANSITVGSGFLALYFSQTHYHSFLKFLTANSPQIAAHSVHVSWLTVIPGMMLNALYEEVTCMGYTFCQLAAKKGPLFALIVTVLLRMSCHTYQGAVHALGIGAVFVVSGLVYWRTRNLWPLIFSHAIVDTVSMGLLKLLRG